ncbi:hypothetical protein [Streptococcus ovuberis]
MTLVYQLLLLFSANMMIRSDAAVVFNGAIGHITDEQISSYLSRNPNNLMLFLYERFAYKHLGEATIWVLQFLNLVYVHLSGWGFYKSAQRFWNQTIADRVFFTYYLLIGMTPKFMAMYTDVLILPFLAVQSYLILSLLDEKRSLGIKWPSLVLGIVTGVGLAFRPTILIPCLAFALVFLVGKQWKQTFIVLGLMVLTLGGSSGLTALYQAKQTEVVIKTDPGLAKNWLTFVNLGLTYSGTDQKDMKDGLKQYLPEDQRDNYNSGLFNNQNQIQEIKRRLREYSLDTFLAHSLHKQFLTTGQGNLNWIYKSASREKSSYLSPLASKTESNPLAQLIRDYLIYTDQPKFQYYDYLIQFVWVGVSLGLVFYFWKPQDQMDKHWLALSLFGGLLFLQIFEGGKSRYLIQFLPQILYLSALGWSNRPSLKSVKLPK